MFRDNSEYVALIGFVNHCKASVSDDLLSLQEGPTCPVFSTAAAAADTGSDALWTDDASGRNCANMLPPTDRKSPRCSTMQSISVNYQYSGNNTVVNKFIIKIV